MRALAVTSAVATLLLGLAPGRTGERAAERPGAPPAARSLDGHDLAWWHARALANRRLYRAEHRRWRAERAHRLRTLRTVRRTLQAHHAAPPGLPPHYRDWLCIHHYEGAWNANTGNGYYGGLQMDITFQSVYGAEFLNRWGTADNWPPWAQIRAAVRAYQSGRGFYPWPNTARACGLI